jgi:hypothetical protein
MKAPRNMQKIAKQPGLLETPGSVVRNQMACSFALEPQIG